MSQQPIKKLSDYAIAVSEALENYYNAVLDEKTKVRDTLQGEIETLQNEKNRLTEEKINFVHSELKKALKAHFYLNALIGDEKTTEISTALNEMVQRKLDDVIRQLKQKKGL